MIIIKQWFEQTGNYYCIPSHLKLHFFMKKIVSLWAKNNSTTHRKSRLYSHLTNKDAGNPKTTPSISIKR